MISQPYPGKNRKRLLSEEKDQIKERNEDEEEYSDDFSGKVQERGSFKESSTSRSSRGILNLLNTD